MPESDDATIAQQRSASDADATIAGMPGAPAAALQPSRTSRSSFAGPRPEILAGYTIVEDSPLGEGGMGVVWKAIQLSTKRLVALKIMSAAGFGSERARLRFEREVELTAKLDHPHIARIYDSGLERGVCFYAMELIDGRMLDEHVQAEHLTRRQIIELMTVICRAVQYAHQKGIIHRDLKPVNIIVDRQGQPHILDFGLAKAIESDQQLSIDGEAAGTPAYMSPEQAGGKVDRLDTRSDVYTLGVILFHLLTGKYPHDTRGSVIEVMSRISREEALRLRSVDTQTDRELDVLLSKAMEKEPERRYGTAGALADDLERYLNNEPLNAQPPTLSYILRKKLRKYRVQVFTGAAVMAALMCMAVWAYAKIATERNAALAANVEKEKQRAEAQRQSNIARNNEALALQNEAHAKSSAEDASRQRAAAQHRLFEMCIREGRRQLDDSDAPLALLWFTQALEAAEPGSQEELFARTYIGTTTRYAMQGQLLAAPLRHPFDVNHAVFSPDGSRFVTVAVRQAYVWETATGQAVGPPIDKVDIVAFSPDGKKLIAGWKDGARILDAATWKPLAPLLPHHGSLFSIAFSADGSRIVTGSGDRTARVWNAETGQPITEPLKHGYVVFNVRFSPDGTRVVTADGEAHVWDAATGQLIGTMGKGGQIIFADFAGDSSRIITAGSQVAIWSVAKLRLLTAPLDGGDLSMCLSPDGRYALAGGVNRAQALDTKTGAPIAPPLSRGGMIGASAFSPDGTRVVTVCTDEAARVWDVATGRLLVGPLGHNGKIYSASFSPDGLRVITASADGTARIWNAAVRAPRPHPFEAREAGIEFRLAAFSADRRKALVYQGQNAQVWDTLLGRPITPLMKHASNVGAIAIDSGGTRVATAAISDHAVSLWDARTGKPVAPMLHHDGEINALAFSPDGTKLASASEDATVRLWDASTGRSIMPALVHKEAVTAISFARDGSRLVTVGGEGLVIWDLATGNRLTSLSLHDTHVLSSAIFSPDGTRILTTGEVSARVWDIASGKGIGAPMTHDSEIVSATFSPDGTKVLTAGDKTARVWDAATGKPLTLPLRHADEVNGAAFSSDGARIVTSSWDGTARLWDASTGQPIAAPLLHDGTVLAAAFEPDDTSVVTVALFASGSASRPKGKTAAAPSPVINAAVRRWDISPDLRPLPDLRALGECLSGRRIHSSGGVIAMSGDELASQFAALKPKYPNEFLPGSVLMPTTRPSD